MSDEPVPCCEQRQEPGTMVDLSWTVIDELHEQVYAAFDTEQAAVHAVSRLARIPWNEGPNQAPCSGGDCGRIWCIDGTRPAGAPRRAMVEIGSSGRRWLDIGSDRMARSTSRKQRMRHQAQRRVSLAHRRVAERAHI